MIRIFTNKHYAQTNKRDGERVIRIDGGYALVSTRELQRRRGKK